MRKSPHENLVLPDDGRPWWWACAEPERPHDEWACYAHSDCSACQIKMQVTATLGPETFVEMRDPLTGERLPTGDTTAADLARTSSVGDGLGPRNRPLVPGPLSERGESTAPSDPDRNIEKVEP